ncbi:MAG: ATP-binding protein [Thermodesulfovibrionales bacterium]|nr:ATP-binding protein [Thermodesulfovibrionales bacterium]
MKKTTRATQKLTNHRAAIEVPSHPMYLSMIRIFLEKLLKLIDIQTLIIEDIKSAVDEACSNVIKYAYKNSYDKTIKVYFSCTPSEITVIVEDYGDKPQDLSFQGRDLSDLRPGGLGMHFIRKAFDEIDFKSRGKKNKLRLVRYM